jgi:Glu-tRNA(Gln) amidotransferase subunit E-like FAD-binding protein
MVEATEIEKHSLEAHVELCAERYNALEMRLDTLDDKIGLVAAMVKEVKDAVSKMAEKNNDRLIAWGVGIIGTLVATTVYLFTHYIIK